MAKNPLEDGQQRSGADTINDMLVFGVGIPENSQSSLHKLVLHGIRSVANGYESGDLTEKARSIRAMKGMLPSADASEKELSFEATTYSPEEIRGGSVRILAGFSGEAVDHFRSAWAIPAPADDNKEVITQPVFKPEEETVALGLIGLGLALSKEAETKRKVLTPDFIWSGEPIELLTQTLGKDGYIEGSQEQRTATVEDVKTKFLTELQGAIKTNDLITRHHRRELARQ
jgi:hypothetical protein